MRVMGAEWVEIVEPRTKEHMYANLVTGECVWDLPRDVPVKHATQDQWWELFDDKSKRFYYYNAPSQKTVWHRPDGADIVPLSKLQTMKNNKGVGGEVKTRNRRSLNSKGNKTSSSTTTTGSSMGANMSRGMTTSGSSDEENMPASRNSYEQHKKRQRTSRNNRVSKDETDLARRSNGSETKQQKAAGDWTISTNSGGAAGHASLDSNESRPKQAKLNMTAPGRVEEEEANNTITNIDDDVKMRHKKTNQTMPKRISNLSKSQSCPSAPNRPMSASTRNHSKSSRKLEEVKDITSFAKSNLNVHKRGLLRKKVTIHTMLSWTRDPIRKPMIMTKEKQVKKDACEVFRLIQAFMGDRKVKRNADTLAHDIITRGWQVPDLRDEIFIQLCRQTTNNPKADSLKLGFELICMCLTFFPPSSKFHSYLEGYIYTHLDSEDHEGVQISHYADVSFKRLSKIIQTGAKRGKKKPTSDEVAQSQQQIFNPSMFGNLLQEVMDNQAAKYPDLKLPWVLTNLAEQVLRLDGHQTEGIFRVPGDIDDVNFLKVQVDQYQIPDNLRDPHVPGSLLKLWFRELEDPLIPAEFYDECVENYNDCELAIDVINKLPEINRLCISYLIRFLQVFAQPHHSQKTKMDASNLAMVMAPNCLRCQSDDPRIIFENTRKEMSYIRTLIQNYETDFMEGIM